MPLDAFPILTVRDLAAARAFYRRLGFVEDYRFPPEGEPAFVTLARGPAHLGLAAGGDRPAERFSYWAYVDDVDAALAELVVEGTPVVVPAHDEPWGERVAQVLDPDGNPVHLGQAPDPAH